jgi:hypothetical protein
MNDDTTPGLTALTGLFFRAAVFTVSVASFVSAIVFLRWAVRALLR